MIGAGISSVDNIIGFVELTEGNFDLFAWPPKGGGQKLRLRAQGGRERTDLEMSLIEPWFLNRRLSLGLDLFRRDARYSSDEYDQVNTGGSLTLGRPFFAFNRINWIYGLEDIDIRNVAEEASDLIKAEGADGSKLWYHGNHSRHPQQAVASRGFRDRPAAFIGGLGGDTDTYQFSCAVPVFPALVWAC